MKEVMAVIRMNMMNKTKKALAESGISSFTAKDCLGRGIGLIEVKTGSALVSEEAPAPAKDNRLYPKRWLSVVIPDKLVKKTVDVIMKINKTGKPGDGKIFVLPVENSIRIRTGEEGDASLDEE